MNPADWHGWTWIVLAFAALAVTYLSLALVEAHREDMHDD